MISYRKKQLLEYIKLLSEFNNSIVLEDNNYTIDTLTQCQNLAMNIGNDLEKRDFDTTELIELLENYCENIYQLSISLENKDIYPPIRDSINNLLKILYDNIDSLLPEDKKEVVFFPYKASMWDSLESVWIAAKNDSECNAYVVPIPYFEKNSDGSFGKMIYEGNKYPDYVPIIHWKEYDIKSRRPDAVFIHNPYDNWNYVTSVHPDFYCKNLRNYTNDLVYIPYFILNDIDPDNQIGIDKIKQFCFNPGTIYSNHVIVQSENIRQIYINEYTKSANEYNLPIDKKELQYKIVGIGSPKTDRILSKNVHNISIPEDWSKLILKSDNTRKKVVLYNTSISALLQNDMAMLNKIKNTLSIFKSKKNDIALIWRPHPLIQQTIQSIRPMLWTEYKNIVDCYIDEGWGIYDDTTEMDSAVIISDVYYGDASSVAELYKLTGKPVMIQYVKHIDEQ